MIRSPLTHNPKSKQPNPNQILTNHIITKPKYLLTLITIKSKPNPFILFSLPKNAAAISMPNTSAAEPLPGHVRKHKYPQSRTHPPLAHGMPSATPFTQRTIPKPTEHSFFPCRGHTTQSSCLPPSTSPSGKILNFASSPSESGLIIGLLRGLRRRPEPPLAMPLS